MVNNFKDYGGNGNANFSNCKEKIPEVITGTALEISTIF